MPLPLHFELTRAQRRRIIEVIGRRCELCNLLYPSRVLQIHAHIGEFDNPSYKPLDRERRILVLCPSCHETIHYFSEEKNVRFLQKKLVLNRPTAVRKEIRKILNVQHVPYIPPDTIDLADAFEEALKLENVFRVT